MTLATDVRFIGDAPISGPELFLLGRRLANIHFEWPFVHSKAGSIRHIAGCPTALARVEYFCPFEAGEIYHMPQGRIGFMRFDTPYSYQDDDGNGCCEVHDRIINALFDIADEQGWAIEWRNDLGYETDPWLRERPIT